jgi:hypothetical protein
MSTAVVVVRTTAVLLFELLKLFDLYLYVTSALCLVGLSDDCIYGTEYSYFALFDREDLY